MRRGAEWAKHIELLKSMGQPPIALSARALWGRVKRIMELHDFVEGFNFDRINLFAYSRPGGVGTFPMISPKV